MRGRFSLPLVIGAPEQIRVYILVAPVGIPGYQDRLERISVPALIVWGTRNTVVPMDQADLLDRELLNSRKLLIQGTRHP